MYCHVVLRKFSGGYCSAAELRLMQKDKNYSLIHVGAG